LLNLARNIVHGGRAYANPSLTSQGFPAQLEENLFVFRLHRPLHGSALLQSALVLEIVESMRRKRQAAGAQSTLQSRWVGTNTAVVLAMAHPPVNAAKGRKTLSIGSTKALTEDRLHFDYLFNIIISF
jgi:hypothetical protein